MLPWNKKNVKERRKNVYVLDKFLLEFHNLILMSFISGLFTCVYLKNIYHFFFISGRELSSQLDEWLSKAKPSGSPARAIIAP